MNNSNKILLNAAIIFTAAGVLLGLADMASGKKELWGVGNMAFETKSYEINERFSDIEVEDVECGIKIQCSPDNRCRVICPVRADGSVYRTAEVNNGVLRIERHDKGKLFSFFSLPPADIEVYLPEGEYGKLTAYSTSGRIAVDEGLSFESARLESVSGSIEMYSDVKDNLRAESTSGRVTVENASPEKLTAKSKSGSVSLSRIRSDDIDASTVSGKIELCDVIASSNLNAESVSGSVELDRCDADKIKIESTSGSVKGTLLSDKTFTVRSSTGSVDIPRSASGGECEISTTSGSIKIEINS